MGGFARFTSIRYLILQTSCFKIIVAICCFTGPQIDSTNFLGRLRVFGQCRCAEPTPGNSHPILIP